MKTKRVTGIGGIFFKAKNNQKLGAWYKKHLGLDISAEWTGCSFPWRDAKKPKQEGCTVWSIFDGKSDYFGSKQQALMINYRVANLKKMLAQLKRDGVWIDPKVESSEYGKFAWIKDGEGNRIELWEPPKKRSGK